MSHLLLELEQAKSQHLLWEPVLILTSLAIHKVTDLKKIEQRTVQENKQNKHVFTLTT
jgi:hypothetical protein